MSGKKFVINAYNNRVAKELKEKFAKKGLLVKVFASNKKKSDSLIEILKESDDLNTMTNSDKSQQEQNTSARSEDEYLKKFKNVTKGGPKHSIAVTRAHHLTNFLSEYIINAFQSAHFDSPEIPDILNPEFDANGFKKEKFSFEISNVELMSDLSALKIFWFASENEHINQIVESFFEKKLKAQIRNTLVSERVINYVPKVVFVRDNTKVLLNQLDEYLMKINLETKMEDQAEQAERSPEESSSEPENSKKKSVDNLYGIEFNKLLESIKKGTVSDFKPITSEPNENQLTLVDQQSNQVFESNLKAFEINKRIKKERLNKSALNRLNQIEFEEFKEKNL